MAEIWRNYILKKWLPRQNKVIQTKLYYSLQMMKVLAHLESSIFYFHSVVWFVLIDMYFLSERTVQYFPLSIQY